MSKRTRRRPTVAVLLGTGAGVMVGLLFDALLVTEPDAVYIVGVVAATGVTGWAALVCLLCDWTDHGDKGHPVRRRPPPSSGPPDGLGQERVEEDAPPVHAPFRPVGADSTDPSAQESVPSFFRRPPTR